MTAAVPVIGAGLSVFGDIQQGKMTSDSLNRQAQNLSTQAQEAEQKGQYDAMKQQLVASQRIGTAVASYGASGVTANSGSVLDVIQASHQNAELDKMNILHGADIRAINYQNQAAMNKYGAASAIQGSYWKALGALTMGAVNVTQFGHGPKTKTEDTTSDEGAATDIGSADSEAAFAAEGMA